MSYDITIVFFEKCQISDVEGMWEQSGVRTLCGW